MPLARNFSCKLPGAAVAVGLVPVVVVVVVVDGGRVVDVVVGVVVEVVVGVVVGV